MSSVLYLDHNATTPPAAAVVQAILECLTQTWGNASSSHSVGQDAKRKLGAARTQVAKLLGCKPNEVVFTSGATEANHMALLGALSQGQKRRIVISAVEHAGVQKLVQRLSQSGWGGLPVKVDLIPVHADGSLNLDAAKALMGDDVALVSVMAANNETGVLMPVAEVAALAHSCGAVMHVDATQLVGKLPFSLSASGADLVSMSAHKLRGPKGIGALIVRQGLDWPALFVGSQERGRRGGTENLPAIVGFGAAAEQITQAEESLADQATRVANMRDSLEQELMSKLPGLEVFGRKPERLPNTTMLRFGALDADLVLHRLEQLGIVASSGAACSSSGNEPSHVLRAMGVPADAALCAVRLSLSHLTSLADVQRLIQDIPPLLGPLMSAAAQSPSSDVCSSTAPATA